MLVSSIFSFTTMFSTNTERGKIYEHVTFGGRHWIMTTVRPYPCYIPQVYLCTSLWVETSRRGSNVTERGEIYKHFKPALL